MGDDGYFETHEAETPGRGFSSDAEMAGRMGAYLLDTVKGDLQGVRPETRANIRRYINELRVCNVPGERSLSFVRALARLAGASEEVQALLVMPTEPLPQAEAES